MQETCTGETPVPLWRAAFSLCERSCGRGTVGELSMAARRMQFSLRTLMAATLVAAIACAAAAMWLRRPVAGRTLDGTEFQLTGRDALVHCVMTNDAKNLRRLLLVNRSDLDTPFGDWTLLQYAVHQQSVACTRLLLVHGADPNLTNGGVPTPLEMAEEKGDPALVAVLREFGAQ